MKEISKQELKCSDVLGDVLRLGVPWEEYEEALMDIKSDDVTITALLDCHKTDVDTGIFLERSFYGILDNLCVVSIGTTIEKNSVFINLEYYRLRPNIIVEHAVTVNKKNKVVIYRLNEDQYRAYADKIYGVSI